jgi:hypothetical protein
LFFNPKLALRLRKQIGFCAVDAFPRLASVVYRYAVAARAVMRRAEAQHVHMSRTLTGTRQKPDVMDLTRSFAKTGIPARNAAHSHDCIHMRLLSLVRSGPPLPLNPS